MGESEVHILKNFFASFKDEDKKEQPIMHDTSEEDVPFVRMPMSDTDVLVLHPNGWFIEGTDRDET